MDELLTYYYMHDIQEIKIGISFLSEGLYIELQGETPAPPEDMAEFSANLQVPREAYLEEYYLEMLGDIHHERENYHVLGSLIDDVELFFDEPIFAVKVFRRG